MSHVLSVGDVITNSELVEIFNCSYSGRMRCSKKKNYLVLISDRMDESNQDTDVVEGEIKYIGMGSMGDQEITNKHNQLLGLSKMYQIKVYHFEEYKKGEYTFRGLVELASRPYQEIQKDENGNDRKVWIFPLKVIDQLEE